MNILNADQALIIAIPPILRLYFAHLGATCPKSAHHSPNHALHSSSYRTMNRFERAASTFTLQRFLSIPRSLVF